MMRTLIALSLIFCFSIAHGQDNQVITYFTKEGTPTDKKDAYFYRVMNNPQHRQDTIFINEFYSSNNKPKLQAKTKSMGRVSSYYGNVFRFYENGNRRSKEYYSIDGLAIDSAYYNYPNGQLRAVWYYSSVYENDKTVLKDSLFILHYDSLGQVLLENGNGIATLYHGDDVAETGTFVQHKKQGLWKGILTDKKSRFEDEYEHGKFVRGTLFDTLGNKTTYTALEIYPEYPGGIQTLLKTIGANFKYTSEMMDNKVNGIVQIGFVIKKDGKIEDIKILRDLGSGSGAAGVAAVKKLKKWSPGMQRGIPVNVSYTLPIRIRL